MSASEGIDGFGTLLQMGDVNTATNWQTVTDIDNLDPPPLTKDVLEFTHHQSPGGYKEKKPGRKDPSELSANLNFNLANATHAHATKSLLQDYDQDTIRYWRVLWTTGHYWYFKGFVKDLKLSVPHNQKQTGTVVVTVAGQPTFVAP